MKIAFDAKRALNNHTGLGNYARNLLNALMRDFPDKNYLLFTPKIKNDCFHQLHGNFKLLFPESKFDKVLHPLWRSFGIKKQLKDEGINIYHGLSNEIPFGKSGQYKTVVTIHDLIFLKYPQQYPWVDRQFYTAKTKYAAKHADTIIAVSEETKRDLIEYYQVPEKKIEVIYPAADPLLQRVSPLRPTSSPPYILHVGSYVSRKNQLKLIEAFSLIANQTDAKLWLVGKGNMQAEMSRLIAEKKLTGRVKLLTQVSNEELRVFYSQANVFVYPSINEGFGMPVVEALLSEVPVIASKGGAIEEAAGKHSLFINPESAEDIAEKILRVLKDENLRTHMVEKGLEHALTMTDKVSAEKMMKVYSSLT